MLHDRHYYFGKNRLAALRYGLLLSELLIEPHSKNNGHRTTVAVDQFQRRRGGGNGSWSAAMHFYMGAWCWARGRPQLQILRSWPI